MKEENKKRYYIITIVLMFVLGLVWRVICLIKNPSFWWDESALGLNFLTKNYSELLHGLDHKQVAPPAFLLLTKLILQVFNPTTDWWRDLCFRILPFVFSCASLPIFYILAKDILNNRKQILFANFIFIFSPCAILYTWQFKQYSMELFVATVLFKIFYDIIHNGKTKIYYYLLLFLAPYFSLSSVFIFSIGCPLVLFCKKISKDITIKTIVSTILGFAFLYFTNLKYVIKANFEEMQSNHITEHGSFITLSDPIGILEHFSDLFIQYPLEMFIMGFILLISVIFFIHNKNLDRKIKILMITPLLFLIIASLLQKYPICARLILFTLPIFAITLSVMKGKFGIVCKVIFLIIFTDSLFSYHIYEPRNSYSYARDVIKTIKPEITPSDRFIIDFGGYESRYYILANNLYNQIIIFDNGHICGKGNKFCRIATQMLPEGKYYMFTTGYGADRMLENTNIEYNIIYPGYLPKQIKALSFNK